MEYGLIGEKLPHSFSKEIHKLIGEYSGNKYDYSIKEIVPENVDSFIKNKDFRGINVTIPYKETVIPFLDEIDDAAREIGAVNTIVNRDGRLCGYNTDFYGLRDLIIHTGIDLSSKKVLILGTGGTSKTARFVCRDLKAGQILIVSRHKTEDTNTYEEVYNDHADADVIINTTPVGMYPNDGNTALDIDRFNRLSGVIDVIYNPLKTALIRKAEIQGIACAGGLRMLVTQAVYAYSLFMNRTDIDLKGITDRVYKDIYRDKLNFVLIGMPGCGKTTVGRRLAQAYDKVFVDTDDMIIEREGRKITDIFASNGEGYFRDVESEVIREVSAKGGSIIATGGGAILRESNVDSLRSNGILVFLDRPLEDLIPTDDRPLASDKDMIKKRYEERYDIYRSVCDIRVEDTDQTEEKIREYI